MVMAERGGSTGRKSGARKSGGGFGWIWLVLLVLGAVGAHWRPPTMSSRPRRSTPARIWTMQRESGPRERTGRGPGASAAPPRRSRGPSPGPGQRARRWQGGGRRGASGGRSCDLREWQRGEFRASWSQRGEWGRTENGVVRLPSPASAERPLAAPPDRLSDRSRRACSSGDDRKASRPPRVREPR
jgi:hypothetical protein